MSPELRKYIYLSIMLLHALAWVIVFALYIVVALTYSVLVQFVPLAVLIILIIAGISGHYLGAWLKNKLRLYKTK